MNPVQTIAARDMRLAQCVGLTRLFQIVWPAPSDEKGEMDVAADLEWWHHQLTTHFFVYDEGVIRAQALLFSRQIFTEFGSITIGALGGVCVHPDYRGRGWGADVARAAFEFLPQLDVRVSLFQTPVPQFYEKLNCRVIDNDFFDGTRTDSVKTNPFADKWQMIYPAAFDWPQGEIDLNGPEY